jgi:small basic protein
MFICLICLLHLQAMFNYEMDLSRYFTCLHVLELLVFIAAIITYSIYLSYMIVLFRIRIFKLFKYVESMSLISLILQQRILVLSAPETGMFIKHSDYMTNLIF